MVDDILERAEAPDRAVRQVDDREAVLPRLVPGGVPSAGGEPAPVRRQRRRIDLAGVALADRQAHDPLKLAVGQRPEPHGLVVGRGREQAAGGVDADAPDWRRVHAGLDAQERPLVGAGLDRGVERGARRPVDRALVAAGVGEPLLQRLDLVRAHLRRIEARRAGGREARKRQASQRRDALPPTHCSSSHRSPRKTRGRRNEVKLMRSAERVQSV